MIRALAEKGGIAGLNYYAAFLDTDPAHPEACRSTVERIAEHAAHYKQVGGIGVLALGSDFDGIDGANYDLTLWVAYYNFLRPHKHNKYKVLNEVEMLQGADNMPGKWQLLIFLGQQTILNMQKNNAAVMERSCCQ